MLLSLPQSGPRIVATPRPVQQVPIAFGVIVPCLVLAGWTLDIGALKSVLPGQPQMVPNTALGFIFASLSLWLLRAGQFAGRSRACARAGAGVVTLTSLLTLGEYLSGLDLKIDTLLFRGTLQSVGASFPGRPSPHTALSFLLIGSAVLLLSSTRRRAHGLAQFLTLAAFLIVLMALVGYIYDVSFLYGITAYTGMALHTAFTFILLSLAILFARPESGLMSVVMSDTTGGHMARHLLPVAILVPIVLGGLIVTGSRAGFYDTSFGMSLCVLMSIVILGAFICRNAGTLHRVDAERRQAEGALRQAHDGLGIKVRERTAELSRVNQTLQAEVVEHKKAEAARMQLLRRLVTAQEEERRRISRELHDHMGQYLSTIILRLKTMQPLASEQESARLNLQSLQELAGQLVDEVHHLAWELRPAALDDLGLQTALQNYTEKWSERSGIVVDFHGGGLERQRLPPEIETTIYRIVQEALTNVLKHAAARRVSLIVERRRANVLVIVEDDGKGFDVESAAHSGGTGRGLGVLGMQERVALVGGALNIESTPGGGTTVRIRVTVSAPAEKEVFPREYFTNRLGR
ncbi:MAG: sensor histidine kinase [Acidobacteria bacterium]|nr:sensor histidine kinase [Acidobacteriota bacterium]